MSPRSNQKFSTWSVVNITNDVTSMSCKLEPAIWLHDTGQWKPCFDRCQLIIAELRRPEGPPSGAPYSSCRGKIKETHELIFSWLSWLAVLLVGAYARRRRRRSCPTWRPYSKNETYSLSLRFTSLILDIPAMIN